MANIRINSLPLDGAPNSADVVAIDGATTRSATLANIVAAGRPLASQSEAQAGVEATKAMTALTTKQAIVAIGGGLFAPITAVFTTPVTIATYSVQTTDQLLLVNYAGAVTINLGQESARSTAPITIKDASGLAATNNITLVPYGTETIEGASSLVITSDYGGYKLLPYSGGWLIEP